MSPDNFFENKQISIYSVKGRKYVNPYDTKSRTFNDDFHLTTNILQYLPSLGYAKRIHLMNPMGE